MKKIAIITLYDELNIGFKLQNYAVQVFFSEMGYDVKTILHWEMYSVSIRVVLEQACRIIGFPKRRAHIPRMQKLRRNRFIQFTEKYLKLGETVNINHIPESFKKKYDFFVTGSDQVWHNWTNTAEEVDFYMLSFAEQKQRIAFAPSFGKTTITSYKEKYIEGLKGFDNLSCREEAGANLINELTGKKAEVLLDPTMLIDREYWEKIEKKPNWVNDDYLLVYSLGERPAAVSELIDKISRREKLQVVDILNIDMKEQYTTSPDEFVYLVHHANCVVTDSFHASVFSILFQTDFVVFDRDTTTSAKMTSRIDTLLGKFNLQDRKMSDNSFESLHNCSFDAVQFVIEKEKQIAKQFIDRALLENR